MECFARARSQRSPSCRPGAAGRLDAAARVRDRGGCGQPAHWRIRPAHLHATLPAACGHSGIGPCAGGDPGPAQQHRHHRAAGAPPAPALPGQPRALCAICAADRRCGCRCARPARRRRAAGPCRGLDVGPECPAPVYHGRCPAVFAAAPHPHLQPHAAAVDRLGAQARQARTAGGGPRHWRARRLPGLGRTLAPGTADPLCAHAGQRYAAAPGPPAQPGGGGRAPREPAPAGCHRPARGTGLRHPAAPGAGATAHRCHHLVVAMAVCGPAGAGPV
ncbi:hypothetical protein D3C71_1426500 [compost metagenome]